MGHVYAKLSQRRWEFSSVSEARAEGSCRTEGKGGRKREREGTEVHPGTTPTPPPPPASRSQPQVSPGESGQAGGRTRLEQRRAAPSLSVTQLTGSRPPLKPLLLLLLLQSYREGEYQCRGGVWLDRHQKPLKRISPTSKVGNLCRRLSFDRLFEIR